jgi:hypothetical protein
MFKNKTKEELETQIQEETDLIAQLESSYPEFVKVNGDHYDRYCSENAEYFRHAVKIQDAYWRRRMAKTALRTLGQEDEERQAQLNFTAQVGS